MRFLPRQSVRVYLNSMSIESPWSLDYKFVIFNLAQIRAYILQGMKQDRTIVSDIKRHINWFRTTETNP